MGHVGLDTVGRPDMPNKHAFLEQSDAARTLAYIRFFVFQLKVLKTAEFCEEYPDKPDMSGSGRREP